MIENTEYISMMGNFCPCTNKNSVTFSNNCSWGWKQVLKLLQNLFFFFFIGVPAILEICPLNITQILIFGWFSMVKHFLSPRKHLRFCVFVEFFLKLSASPQDSWRNERIFLSRVIFYRKPKSNSLKIC